MVRLEFHDADADTDTDILAREIACVGRKDYSRVGYRRVGVGVRVCIGAVECQLYPASFGV